MEEDKENFRDPTIHRRPLPTPQRPSTPTTAPPSTFYSNPPPLPTRPLGVGSTHTTTSFVAEEPPHYSSDFREPELVSDEQILAEEFPAVGSSEWNRSIGTVSYEDASTWNDPTSRDWQKDTWDLQARDYASSWYNDPYTHLIYGRDLHEESNWWDADNTSLLKRPGPGMLPSRLAENLHNSEHALYRVTPSVPAPLPQPPDEIQITESTSSSSTPPRHNKSPPPPPPSEEEINRAIPHPFALYCPKDNGWILLHCDTFLQNPPLAHSFETSEHDPLPDLYQRNLQANCLDKRDNKTHHFHRYERAVDARRIEPPYHVDEWETIETLKQKRRAGKVIMDEFDLEKMKVEEEEEEVEEEGKLLDLFICCQCSLVCVSSSVIPGVIPLPIWNDFIQDKKNNPIPGKSPDLSVVVALETLLMAIENKLWKGESRRLRVTRQGFQRKLGWNAIIRRIFLAMGFDVQTMDTEETLSAPRTDISDPQGRQNRAKLLRIWLEISAWLQDFISNHRSAMTEHKPYPLSVQIETAREVYQQQIGADPDSMPRGDLGDLSWNVSLSYFWEALGITTSTFSSDMLIFAYLAQCRCDPKNTVWYFTALKKIVDTLVLHANCPQPLIELTVYESSRDRFDEDEVAQAAIKLGFGEEERLRVPYDADVPEDFIVSAWKDCLKTSWLLDPESAQQLQRDASNALRIIAEQRRSPSLRKIWEENKDLMTPDRAYDTLEVPKDVDDQMLLMIFSMRLDEQPAQINKMRTALEVIAQVRSSDRLRLFLESGQDPGESTPTVGPDWPRGLNQLGNTCYLNSLLQYFNTIKYLREAVLSMRHMDIKSLEDDKLTDDELKKHRVGGRLVTRREIIRSKRFVQQLADLFYHMEYSDMVSVTPSIELAKLALVTSKDEEDDETDKGGTDSSNDTDATLVDDAVSGYPTAEQPPPQSPVRTAESALGKKVQKSVGAMDIDDNKDDSPPPLIPLDESQTRDKDGDVIMRPETPATTKKAPPLPPRKSDSVMMFGRQHDVAECMDNCMFQIETALLKFDGMEEEEGSDKTSVVKRLFYGKTRQHLLIPPDPSKSRTPLEPKVELFNHLPVNVDEEGFDIYDALGRYFDDIVDYEGQRVPMQLALLDLPPLLQIQLQRVQFDRESLQSWKSQAYVKFGETIYLDRFMESADPQKRAQSKQLQEELHTCRERLRLLTRKKDGPCTAALSSTREFLSHADFGWSFVDDELIFDIQGEESLIQTEVEELRTRMSASKAQLEAIWEDHQDVAYELASVFIHRGTSPSWGHYFFYSRHLPESPDAWFKYNDSEVSRISKEEVFADTSGSTANPYLLVFARKGSEVVDTVKRFDPSDIVQDYEKSRS